VISRARNLAPRKSRDEALIPSRKTYDANIVKYTSLIWERGQKRRAHSNPGRKQFRFFIRLSYVLKRGCPAYYSHPVLFLFSSIFFFQRCFAWQDSVAKQFLNRVTEAYVIAQDWIGGIAIIPRETAKNRFCAFSQSMTSVEEIIQIRYNSFLVRRDDIAIGETL